MEEEKLEELRNLKFENFKVATNLITKVDQVTFDKVGKEENDYFDITLPHDFYGTFVISFFKECELVKVILADENNLEKSINYQIGVVFDE